MSVQDTVREVARRWLSEGAVRYVLGYERGSDGFIARPFAASAPEDAERLVWDPGCVGNLACYLIDEWRRAPKRGEEPDTRPVGIVVKGCDSRSIALLVQEHIITLDDVKVIGIPCKGTVDPRRMSAAWVNAGHAWDGPLDAVLCLDGEKVAAEWGGGRAEFEWEDVVFEKCKVCRYPNPVIYDELACEVVAAKDDDYADVKELDAMDVEERWAFWEGEFSRCVRCYACRNICPACYCKECSVARTDPAYGPRKTPLEKACTPNWTEKTPTTADNLNFHLSRMYHLIGRCTNCNECDRACPMDIPLRLLTRKLERDTREMLGYEPGTSTDPRSLLAEYDADDPGGFIR